MLKGSNVVSKYVFYLVVPSRRGLDNTKKSDDIIAKQQVWIKEFMVSNQALIIKTFSDESDPYRRNRKSWVEFKKAISYAEQHNASLIVGQIKNTVNNFHFMNHLINFVSKLNYQQNIILQEYPEVDKFNLIQFAESKLQKISEHKILIQKGLCDSKLKGKRAGNPNVKKIIKRINKPKSDCATMFAIIIDPIIAHYQAKGYSQRYIVGILNEKEFSAPEGGKWVLSQYQKVLARVEKIRLANIVDTILNSVSAADEEILLILDSRVSLKNGMKWTLDYLQEIRQVIDSLNNMVVLNNTISHVMENVIKRPLDEYDDKLFLSDLNKSDLNSEVSGFFSKEA